MTGEGGALIARLSALLAGPPCFPSLDAQSAGGAGGAAIAPVMPSRAFALVAGEGILADQLTSVPPPSSSASAQVSALSSHISGVSITNAASIPSEIACASVCSVRCGSRDSRRNRSRTCRRPACDAAPIGERRRVGEEQQVAAGHERLRQALVAQDDLGVARQRRVAEAPELRKLDM